MTRGIRATISGRCGVQIQRITLEGRSAMNNVSICPAAFGQEYRFRAAVGKHPRPRRLSAEKDAIEDSRGQMIIAADDYPTNSALFRSNLQGD